MLCATWGQRQAMASNDVLVLTFTNDDPNDHGISYDLMNSVVTALQVLVRDVVKHYEGTAYDPLEKDYAGLILDVSPRAGSIELRFKLHLKITRPRMPVRHDRMAETDRKILTRMSELASVGSFILALVGSPEGLVNSILHHHTPDPETVKDPDVVAAASNLQKSAGESVLKLHRATAKTGCAKVTIQYLDSDPIVIIGPNDRIIGRNLAGRFANPVTSASMITRINGPVVSIEYNGQIYQAFQAQAAPNKNVAGSLPGRDRLVTALWPNGKNLPKPDITLTTTTQPAPNWKTSAIAKDDIPEAFEQSQGVVIVTSASMAVL